MLQKTNFTPRSTDLQKANHPKVIKFQLCSSQESAKVINFKCDMEKRIKTPTRSSGRKSLLERNMPTIKSDTFSSKLDHKKSTRNESRCQTPKTPKSVDSSPKNLNYDSGDYVLIEGKLRKSHDDVIKCLNSFGQNVKLNSSSDNQYKFEDTLADTIEENQHRVDMIFSEKKKEFLSKSTESESSIIESGYLTNSNNSSQSANGVITHDIDKVELKRCNSKTELYSPAGENEDQVCEAVIKLFGTNAKLAKLLKGTIEYTNSEGKPISINSEIKKCLNKEIAIEENLDRYLSNQISNNKGTSVVEETYFYDMKNLDESMEFVKENLAGIREELSDFKESCWSKIESKVNKTEFVEVAGNLKSKMGHLERKLLSEQKVMKQDIMFCKEKLKNGGNMAQCGIRSFPFWPFIAFLGAYSIMYFGNKA